MVRPLPLAVVLAVSSVPLSAQAVWVVDDDAGPGVDFAEIQAAVDAVADGDVVLVRPGSYAPFTIDGKSLTVHGDGATRPTMRGPLAVDDLPLGAGVVVRGIDVEDVALPGPLSINHAIRAFSNAGPVWFEDIRTNTEFAFPFTASNTGSLVFESASVVFARCELVAIGSDVTLAANPGLGTVDSTVALYGCLVRAGVQSPNGGFTFDGSDGIRMSGGTLFLSGCDVAGGDGVDGSSSSPCVVCAGGDAGDGMFLSGADPSASVLDSVVVAGTPGLGSPCAPSCSPGDPGLDYRVVTGTLTPLAGVARGMNASSPVREGETATDTWSGAPFDLVVQVFTFAQAPAVQLPGITGPSVLDPPFFTRVKGLLNLLGTKNQSSTLGELGPGLAAIGLYKQSLFVDIETMEVLIGAPTFRLLLDDSI
jgi:hypothetical protein